jgi:hypothetical protein
MVGIPLAFVLTVAASAVAVPVAVRSAAISDGVDAADASRRAAIIAAGIAAWLALTAAIVASGGVAPNGGPPRILGLILPAFVGTFALSRTPWARAVAIRLPVAALVGYQAFRIPVELVLVGLARHGIAPVQMTVEGWNFDLVTGISAAILGIAALRVRLPRALVLGWNAMGLGLLANVVIIAVRSVPGPLRSLDGAPNLVPTTLPYVWLPVFLVPLALIGHLLVFRRLWAQAGVTSDRQAIGGEPAVRTASALGGPSSSDV